MSSFRKRGQNLASSSATGGVGDSRNAATEKARGAGGDTSRPRAERVSAADGRGLELSLRSGRQARELSPLPPGQDPGPAASIRYRQSQPRRGTTSLMSADDHFDRAMFMSSSGSPG